jgi:hypothetical protein
MRVACVPLLLAVLLETTNAQAGTRGYGIFDVGGLVAVPTHPMPNEFGVGFAFSGGAELGELIQIGGRFRFARVTEKPCDGRSGYSCDYAWSGYSFSLGAELRLRIALSPRWAVAVGVSAAFGGWIAIVSGDTCCGGGLNLAGDVRVSYRLVGRLGVHLAFEQQRQYMGDYSDLDISTLWVGLNW